MHTKVCGLIGARFLDARNFSSGRSFCTEVCNIQQTSCARSVYHTLRDGVLGRHLRHKDLKIRLIRKKMVKKYGPNDEVKIKVKKDSFNTLPMKEIENKISQLRKDMEE